jgi:hypothetical protein
MMIHSLRQKMAQFGFEANDDYGFQVHCLLHSQVAAIRCLNLEGDVPRLRTAFASALALALDYPNSLYHDFSQSQSPLPKIILPPGSDELGREEPGIEPFDDLMSQACALSEAESTIVILDQLQRADFREHIRIARFLEDHYWHIGDASYYANPLHLLVVLISEQPIYHSLRKVSYRLWVNSRSERRLHYQPQDFALGPEALETLGLLDGLFETLGVSPTKTEYERLLHDLRLYVRTTEELRQSLYAWVEGVDRAALRAEVMEHRLRELIGTIPGLAGVDEVELQPP